MNQGRYQGRTRGGGIQNPGGRQSGTRVLTFLMLLLIANSVTSGDLYKWQDENGIWHFSDRPPATADQKFESVALPVEPEPMVTERKAGTKWEPVHYFYNHYAGPAQLELRLKIAENIQSDPPMPARIVLPPQKEIAAVKFSAADATLGFRYQIAYTLVPGPPVTELPTEIDFYPPFPGDMEFPISQGFDGDSTHKDDANRYAVDIVMPIGTPILAARGGIVMDKEDDYHGGEQTEKFMDRANRVRILHDDGSMALYAHLQPNSVRVYPGARIPAGTWIANSGNTGYSSGPHLHFVIQINVDLSLESIPFRFRTPTGGTLTPEGPGLISGVFSGP